MSDAPDDRPELATPVRIYATEEYRAHLRQLAGAEGLVATSPGEILVAVAARRAAEHGLQATPPNAGRGRPKPGAGRPRKDRS